MVQKRALHDDSVKSYGGSKSAIGEGGVTKGRKINKWPKTGLKRVRSQNVARTPGFRRKKVEFPDII
jgi:hypothetical protein